ncbi:MAG: hypothetical protein IJY70_01140, partial [Clostridia bacterium]|nr:hypothetical protein [Clostridia bacterium]
MEKQEITTNLLTLRGGLSVISQITDKIRAEEERVIKEKNIIDERKAKIEELQSEILNEEAKLTAQKEELLRIKEEKERKIKPERIEKIASKKVVDLYPKIENLTKKKWFSIFLTTAITLALLFAISMAGNLLIGIIGLSVCVLAIVGVIVWIIARNAYMMHKRKSMLGYVGKKIEKEIIDEYNTRIKDLEKIIVAPIVKNIERLRAEQNEINGSIEEQKNVCEIVKSGCGVKIEEMALNAKAIKEALLEKFSVFLSESDWSDIDLVMYYIETGRADSIKEALKQVDQLHQTEQIIKTIKEANESMEILVGNCFERMGNALAQSFSELNNSIVRGFGKLSRQM